MTASSTYVATDGASYERFLGRWTRALAPEFATAMRLPAEGPLLEIGCGTGSLALTLAERYPARPVTGIDIAPPYIEFARSRVGAHTALRFNIGDACALNLPDRSFAATLAQLVLNFTPDPARAVGEMMRVTRSGGVVGGCVWDFRGGLVYQRLFWDSAAGVDPGAAQARDRLFSGALALPDGLTDLWRAAGLRDVERISVTSRMDYVNFADYWEPLFSGQGPVGVYTDALSPDLRARIEEIVRRAYLSGAPDGPRSMTATAWAVRGIVP